MIIPINLFFYQISIDHVNGIIYHWLIKIGVIILYMINDNSNKKLNKLSILDLRIWVHLGCSDHEKFHPQLVSFNIDIVFKEPPKAIVTDNISDTICYLDLVNNIQTYCHNKYFNLIERLTYSVHEIITSSLELQKSLISSINVEMKKVSPPVPNVHGGVTFTYSN